MRMGIFAAGSGRGATAAYVATAAQASEEAGFSCFLFGEHVVLFDDYESKYPYAPKGDPKAGLPHPKSAFYDPIIAMTWAAAVTKKIELATGILILPQRNPVVLAKELATLDDLSGGRVMLGVGVGWSKEEYDAIGVNWSRRGKDMNEYIRALRSLWEDEVSTFHGESVSFDRAYCYPKPVRNGHIPIVVGGENENVLKRVALYCDGWMPVALSPSEAPQKIAHLHALTKEAGRDPSKLRIIKSITSGMSLDTIKRYRDGGVTEFLLIATPEMPREEAEVKDAIARLGEKFVAEVEAL